MLQKLEAGSHAQPFRGPFTITRVQPGDILGDITGDTAFGPLAIIDHAVMKKGLTIKMHEHVNDEILSYISTGVTHHKDSAGFEAPIARGKLMMMNAGAGFWHEEKVKEDEVEMLQIFVRPKETDLLPEIQFHDKPVDNRDWYVMVGPEGSECTTICQAKRLHHGCSSESGRRVGDPDICWFHTISIRDGRRNCDAKSYHC